MFIQGGVMRRKKPPRLSIAALMGCVLLAALGFAVLRYPTEWSASIIFCLTCGILCLAVVGACFKQGRERAWWVGFAVFGWGYLTFTFAFFLSSNFEGLVMRPGLPWVIPLIGLHERIASALGQGNESFTPFLQISACGCVLICAVIGAALARYAFAASTPASGADTPADVTNELPRIRRRRSGAVVAIAAILFAVLAIVAITRGTEEWSDAVLLLTAGYLSTAVIAAVFGPKTSRFAWLAAALVGWGYLILALDPPALRRMAGEVELPKVATTTALKGASTRVPFLRDVLKPPFDRDPVSKLVMDALETTFPAELGPDRGTTVGSAIEDFKAITKRDSLPAGIRFKLDEESLGDGRELLESRIVDRIEADKFSIKTALSLILKRHELEYVVVNGRVLILGGNYRTQFLKPPDAFERVGDCVFALLAAGLGYAGCGLLDVARWRRNGRKTRDRQARIGIHRRQPPPSDNTAGGSAPRFRPLVWLVLFVGLLSAVAIGGYALRVGSHQGASALFFVTCGVLFFAITGAICGQDRARISWLACAAIGWSYFLWAIPILQISDEILDGARLRPRPPTLLAIAWLRTKIGPAAPAAKHMVFFDRDPYLNIGDCLFTLLFAALGGIAVSVWHRAVQKQSTPRTGARSTVGPGRVNSLQRIIAVLGVAVAIATWAAWAIATGSETCSNAIFLLTCGVLATFALGAATNCRPLRARWFGAALFGWAYLWLAFDTPAFRPMQGEPILSGLMTTPHFEDARARVPFLRDLLKTPSQRDPANRAIYQALDQPFPARVRPDDDPRLGDLFNLARSASRSQVLPKGIPISANPSELVESEVSLTSQIDLDLEPGEVRIGRALELTLGELNMAYFVKRGAVIIVDSDHARDFAESYDPFQRVGHGLLALIAAAIGCAASFIADGTFFSLGPQGARASRQD
jgi:hypothetical protein